MYKKAFCALACLLFLTFCGFTQKVKPEEDSTAYYDELFGELENFIDSLTAPRNMILINLGIGNGFFNYQGTANNQLSADRKLYFNPSIGYFGKNGFGINAAATVVDDGTRYNPFQLTLSGSFDYLKNSNFITGISLSHFFTKDSLPFYTSPLENEAAFYFTYKDLWIKPSITASYGWGSSTDYEEREEYITSLRLRPRGYTRINTKESISDFTLSASLRHDFYWRNLITNKSIFRFTPQIVFTSGTQRFGFNQTSNTYAVNKKSKVNVMYNSQNVFLDETMEFQPLSLTAFLKSEMSFGKFFLQPQVAFDYYLPAKERAISTAFTLNTGFIF